MVILMNFLVIWLVILCIVVFFDSWYWVCVVNVG